MKRKEILLFLMLCSSTTFAQYTDIINSNKPGFSESPYSVGTGVYQFESNMFFRRANATPTFSNPQAYGLGLQFRTSFFKEELEFSSDIKYVNNKRAFKNIFESSYLENGFELTLGAKYLFYKAKDLKFNEEIRSLKKRYGFSWKQWIPDIAAYAGVNFFDPLKEYYGREQSISPRVGVLLQNQFSSRYNFITNIYYDYITTKNPELSIITTGTYNFNYRWSAFAEAKLRFNKFENQSSAGVGAAYLLNRIIQINASTRATIQEDAVGFYTSLGVSYRIDRHIDKYIDLNEVGNEIIEEKPIKYDENRSFFGKLFSKIGKLFKKKDTSLSKKDSEGKPEKLKRKPSVLDDILKNDKREKRKEGKNQKRQTKAEQRKLKKAKKEEEKAEKKRLKEEEKRKKEEERLQKEIEELDKKIEEEDKKAEEEKKKKDKNKKDNESKKED